MQNSSTFNTSPPYQSSRRRPRFSSQDPLPAMPIPHSPQIESLLLFSSTCLLRKPRLSHESLAPSLMKIKYLGNLSSTVCLGICKSTHTRCCCTTDIHPKRTIVCKIHLEYAMYLAVLLVYPLLGAHPSSTTATFQNSTIQVVLYV